MAAEQFLLSGQYTDSSLAGTGGGGPVVQHHCVPALIGRLAARSIAKNM